MMTILEQEFYETVMHSIRDLANNLGEVAKEIREYEISRNNTLNEISGYLKVISEETKKQTRMAEQMSAGYQMNCCGVTHEMIRCNGCAYLTEGDDGEWVCDDCGKEIHSIPDDECSANQKW